MNEVHLFSTEDQPDGTLGYMRHHAFSPAELSNLFDRDERAALLSGQKVRKGSTCWVSGTALAAAAFAERD